MTPRDNPLLQERQPPTCECLSKRKLVETEEGSGVYEQVRTGCWTRLEGDATQLFKVWDAAHAPKPSAPDVRNYFVRLVIPGHEDGMPVIDQGEGWVIVDSPGEEA